MSGTVEQEMPGKTSRFL